MSTTMRERLRALDAEEATPHDAVDNLMQEWVPLLLLNGPTRKRLAIGLNYLEAAHFTNMASRFVVRVAKGVLEADGELPECPKDPRNDYLRLAINSTLTVDDPWCDDVMALLERVDEFRRDDYKFVPQVLEHYEQWLRRAVMLHKTTQASLQVAQGQLDQAQDTLDSIQTTIKPADKDERTRVGFFTAEAIDYNTRPQATSHFPLTVSTLMAQLNNGGPGRGHTLFYMARTNGGKSLFMCNDAVTLACQGYKVLFVSLEMSTEELTERCYTMFSGFSADGLRERLPDLKGQGAKQLAKFGGVDTIRFERYANGSISTKRIKQSIEELKVKEGWVADVVVVDYLELLAAEGVSRGAEPEHTRQKMVSNDLKALAQETDTLVITGTQSNREGAKREAALGLEHAGESYAKLQPTDFIVCINQNTEQKIGDAASGGDPYYALCVEKNRKGPVGGCHLVRLNTRTLKLRQMGSDE